MSRELKNMTHEEIINACREKYAQVAINPRANLISRLERNSQRTWAIQDNFLMRYLNR